MSGTSGSVAGASAPDREFELLCDVDAGVAVQFLRRYSVTAAGVVTPVDLELDGVTPYAVTGTVSACPVNVIDHETLLLCDANGGVAVQFLRRYSVDASGEVTTADTTLDGVTDYAVTGSVASCPQEPTSPQIDSTVQRQIGAGGVNVVAGARSVTFLSLAGAPTVSIGGGAAVAFPAGTSATWSVDKGGESGEALADAFAFAGLVGDEFIVLTTREL